MLLAFDTATPLVSVAAYDGNRVVAEHSAELPMRHGEQLAPLIEEVLAEAGISPADLTQVAAGVGPGPFTGLRVGLVTARTLGYALGIPVVGVCSLDALAVEAVATGAVSGEFAVAIDARRKEVYLAAYDARGRRVGNPIVERPDVVATGLAVVGAGPVLYPEAFPQAVGPTRPSAGWLARAVAEGLADVLPPEPLYLRRPDAEAPGKPKPVS